MKPNTSHPFRRSELLKLLGCGALVAVLTLLMIGMTIGLLIGGWS